MENTYNILVIDCSEQDIDVMAEAIKTKPQYQLDARCMKLSQARAHLEQLSQDKHKSLPDLLVMTDKLYEEDSLEMLKFAKQDARLSKLPIVIFTQATLLADVKYAYEQYANNVVVKPTGAEDLSRVFLAICDFWFKTALRPEHD